MSDKTKHDAALPDDLHGARAAAWAEHQQRCADDEPYTDGVTAGALTERVERLRPSALSVPTVGQDYAQAVSIGEGPPSDDIGVGDEDSDAECQLSWVAVLPECDRRLFAEEMSQLLAEAAETDDLASVEQALREWRVTAETYSDPELAQRFSGPRLAHGERVPRPVA